MKSAEMDVVAAFADAINAGDVAGLVKLMAEDHVFVDSCGTTATGLEQLAKGWGDYFRMFPDYRITLEHVIQEGHLIAAFGMASGTYNGLRGLVAENRITMPAAWKAVVENGKIKLWQVYADWSQGQRIIEADRKTGQ